MSSHPVYEGMDKKQVEKLLKKWTVKDYVMLILTITGIVLAVYFGTQSSKRGASLQRISKVADTIQQNNYYLSSPQNLKNAIVAINTLSSDSAVMPRENK